MLITKISDNNTVVTLRQYKAELQQELNDIINYWMNNVTDEINEGFYGSVANDNKPDKLAAKGIVLNSRILWTFSATAHYLNNQHCKEIADIAYKYIELHFVDKQYGGVFWSVNYKGNMLDSKKQMYGLAFCIYGLVEYYKLTNDDTALSSAKKLFHEIEQYSFDIINNGYTEALTRNWQPADNLRLSDKDSNEKKTMNTHLHIIEAYSNLYSVWPEISLREKIINLLAIFDKFFLDRSNFHYRLFMSGEWESKSMLQSFGHDIEASWLLHQCAEISGDRLYTDLFKKNALLVVDAAASALDKDGGMWYEYDPAVNQLVKEKHWWPQAEAMIGFFNAWQLSGNEKYLHLSINSWQFVKTYIKDYKNGEWFWGVEENYSIIQKDKAGFWKCPYHNARACIEISKRISSL